MAIMVLVASRDFEAWIDVLPWLLAVLFCANVVSATQDIATDGYAVTHLTPERRGLGNSLQVVGYKLGMVAGSGGLLWLVSHYGWQASYGGLACLMLLVIVPVLFMADDATPKRRQRRTRNGTGCAATSHCSAISWRGPGMPWWFATIALYKFGDSLASRMTGPLLSDSGLSLAQIGVMTGVAGATAGVLGAFVGGATLLRIGHREALLAFGAMQALGLAAYLTVVAGLQGAYAIGAVVYFEQFADGLSTVALFTLMMDRCRAHSPGTDYSLQASLMVLVTGVAATTGGLFTDRFGYGAVFATASVLTLCALVPATLSFRRAGARGARCRRLNPRDI